jgi:broad specificity phosphatase PhoE
MKKLIVFLLFITTLSYGQEATTFILVRHAEKAVDGGSDPVLTDVGYARAQNILGLFKDADISAIYSTNYKRTMLTVAPLSKEINKEIVIYDPRALKEFADRLLQDNQGGTVIVSGHSNTTPSLANLLLGEETFKQFDEDDYGNLIIITIMGGEKSKLLHIRY